MIETILLAGGLTLVALVTATYLLVQRKARTLDEAAFRRWFMQAFLGMRLSDCKTGEQGLDL